MAEAKRKLRPYRSYFFKERDPILDKVMLIRENSGMTDTQVAEESGLSKSTISNWETRTRRPQFATIAAFLGVHGIDILDLIKVKRRSVRARDKSHDANLSK